MDYLRLMQPESCRTSMPSADQEWHRPCQREDPATLNRTAELSSPHVTGAVLLARLWDCRTAKPGRLQAGYAAGSSASVGNYFRVDWTGRLGVSAGAGRRQPTRRKRNPTALYRLHRPVLTSDLRSGSKTRGRHSPTLKCYAIWLVLLALRGAGSRPMTPLRGRFSKKHWGRGLAVVLAVLGVVVLAFLDG